MTTGPGRLLHFVASMTRLVETTLHEPALLDGADTLLRELVAQDDWLPPASAVAHPQFYQQHLLYGDPLERFCVVSFVWGPGQETPVHDHATWGVIGMLRGAEYCALYAGAPPRATGHEDLLKAGQTTRVSPSVGDVHRVRNASADSVSISIHVYGGNIGRIQRHVFDPVTGASKDFVSGYANTAVPNLWAGAAA